MGIKTFFDTVTSEDMALEIIKQNVAGHVTFRKFFANPIAVKETVEDLWDNAPLLSVLNYDTVGKDYVLVSTNEDDTQLIRIHLLDEDYNVRIVEKNLNGIVNVPVNEGFQCLRCYRMSNIDTTNVLGNVTVSSTGIGSSVKARIRTVAAIIPNNQTFMSQFTIPAGYTGYITDINISMALDKDAKANIYLEVRDFGQVFRKLDKMSISSIATSQISRQYSSPIVVPEKSDIRVQNYTNEVIAIDGNYGMILVKNELINKFYSVYPF